jgi:formate hydrogenlyase subunit 6/NADH:ubiquinone oxidoreductase subunit I
MQMAEPVPKILRALCTLCGDCVAVCPVNALQLIQEELVLDLERCAYCGDCEDVCPVGAIELPYQVVIVDSQGNPER